MNKSLLIVGGILVVAGIGFFLFKNQQTTPPPSPPTETGSPITTAETPGISDTRYIPYSSASFAAATDKKRVLFFYANWCPTCRPINIELEQNLNQIPEDVMIFRINYNDTETDQTDKNLARQYGITYQHTFVLVDASGAEIKKWNGGGLTEIIDNTK